MLRISLVFTLALLVWPLAALAQNNDALQIFEFDYDQKTAPIVNLPPKAEVPIPAPAPAKAQAPAPAPVKAAAPAPTPAPAKAAAPAPIPAAAPAPAKAVTPAPAAAPVKAQVPAPAKAVAPAKAATPISAASQGGVITIIGEPDPPGTRYDDYLPDYRTEEINLSPAGLPPTTQIPAKPGEARVEKSGGKAAAKPAPAPVAQRPVAEEPVFEPGSIQHFWQFAHRNWARYGGTIHSRPPSASPVRTAAAYGTGGMIGYTASGIPLQDLTQFSGFYK